jgi:aminoglycoside 6'-N-acetyltransferase I
MEITDLRPDDWDAIHQAAALLVAAFREHWPTAWPDMKSALQEVRESFGEGRVSRIAVEDGVVLGWVGGIPGYGGNVWEVHPLVVHPHHQGRGIGRALLADLEALAAERGALTLWVGTDDEDGMTSLAGVDLYDDLLGHLARIRNLRGHPYEFYQKVGFVIAGVVPDANGPGKPDILMAKRVHRRDAHAQAGRSEAAGADAARPPEVDPGLRLG